MHCLEELGAFQWLVLLPLLLKDFLLDNLHCLIHGRFLQFALIKPISLRVEEECGAHFG